MRTRQKGIISIALVAFICISLLFPLAFVNSINQVPESSAYADSPHSSLTAVLYHNVTFSESGLPLGTVWYVNLTGGTSNSSKINTLSFSLPNGVYEYSIAAVNKSYKPSSSTGKFNVSNSPQYISISFSLVTFPVAFTESGLASGTTWWVSLNGRNQSTSSATITFSEPNGTYTYSIASNPEYSLSKSSGSIPINGSSESVYVIFSLITYVVTFHQTGLPSPTKWYVNVTGGESFSSTNGSITFLEPNGNYTYALATPNKEYSPQIYSSYFRVEGNPVNITAVFSLVTYSVTFQENGLPNGTTWYLNITGGDSHSSTNRTISFLAPNGTYYYTIDTANSLYKSIEGSSSFTVHGKAVKFILVTYAVTFSETGLPAGTAWSVQLNGKNVSSTTSNITFQESNGTYSYSIAHLTGYALTASSGYVTVNGAPRNISVVFVPSFYKVVFNESGLPKGATWSVTITGTTFNGQSVNSTVTSTSSAISFLEPNGTYNYATHVPSGYAASSATGGFDVSGTLIVKQIVASSAGILPTLEEYLIEFGIAIAVIVVAIVVLMMTLWKKRKILKII